MLEQEEEHTDFHRNQDDCEKYYESHVADLINGVVADRRWAPFGTCVHDKPNNIKDNTGNNQRQSQPNICPVKEAHEIDGQQADKDYELNQAIFTLRKSDFP